MIVDGTIVSPGPDSGEPTKQDTIGAAAFLVQRRPATRAQPAVLLLILLLILFLILILLLLLLLFAPFRSVL